jgi:hypothetical protein
MIGGFSIKMNVGFHALHNPISMPGQKRKTAYDWWSEHQLLEKPKRHWLVLGLFARIRNKPICTSATDNPTANTCGYLSSVYWHLHAKKIFEWWP